MLRPEAWHSIDCLNAIARGGGADGSERQCRCISGDSRRLCLIGGTTVHSAGNAKGAVMRDEEIEMARVPGSMPAWVTVRPLHVNIGASS